MTEHDNVEAARAVYDASATGYVDFVGTELSDATERPIDRSLLVAFAEMTAAHSAGRVADVGCGPGRVAAFLSRQGLDVVGVDVSAEMLARARSAHPHLQFEEGRLDRLPFPDASLAGAVCWYSIIYTPPPDLDVAFAELARVIHAGGETLFAFQEGDGGAEHRRNARGTGLALTVYRHAVEDVTRRLTSVGLVVHATVRRAAELDHETTPQAFVFARRG